MYTSKSDVGGKMYYYKVFVFSSVCLVEGREGAGRHIIVIYVFLNTQLLVLYYQIYDHSLRGHAEAPVFRAELSCVPSLTQLLSGVLPLVRPRPITHHHQSVTSK